MNGQVIKWLVFLCFTHILVHAKFTQDLHGQWNVRNSERAFNLSAYVPGGIYTDLMENKVIGDVFYRFNDIETRWVSKLDWTYSRSFIVDPNLAKLNNINLIFDGVDTFSEIYLNGDFLGTTDNMFVRYIFPIKSKLKGDVNYLEVRLKSPVNKAKELFDKQDLNYSIRPLCAPDEYNGECHVNHIRKMQASFGWDCGPALPSMGIWKNVYMEGYNDAVMRDVTVKTSNSVKGYWSVKVGIYLEGDQTDVIKGDFRIKLDTDDETEECLFENENITNRNEQGEFLANFTCKVEEDKVELWWPNGYGEAKLYKIDVSYVNRLDANKSDNRTFKIGYRTVNLMDNQIENGRIFCFVVNDVPIFAKGANSIPISILPERSQNETTIRFLLQSAKDVHMNMIRVWGGGSYEDDVFYKIADELGIMIWQDFMFACSMYPTDKNFLEYGTNNRYDKVLVDYLILYNITIRDELFRNDDSRQYMLSSPTYRIVSKQKSFIEIDQDNSHYGDAHFYDYTHDSWSTSHYRPSRFVSEYGYQSLPSYYTLSSAANYLDLKIGSDFLNSRQHQYNGYDILNNLINHQLSLPQSSSGSLKTLIYCSQIIQAIAVKKQTEYYRQWRSHANGNGKGNGRGYTMGALYWQLNDVWVAPTWSGIDFNNNWKMLHYYAKNFFAPIIVTADEDAEGFIKIYVVSDLKVEIFNVSLNILVYKWDSIDPVDNITFKIDLPPLYSTLVRNFSIKKHVKKIENHPCEAAFAKNCFVWLTLTSEEGKSIAPDNFVFLSPLNQINGQKYPPTIHVTNISQTEKQTEYEIEITTDNIALFVWLETKPIIRSRFSENGFIQVTRKRIVRISTELVYSVEEIQQALELSYLHILPSTDTKTSDSSKAFYIWVVILVPLLGIVVYVYKFLVTHKVTINCANQASNCCIQDTSTFR